MFLSEKSLDSGLKNKKIPVEEFERFCKNFDIYIQTIQQYQNPKEDVKTHLIDFLRDTWYNKNEYEVRPNVDKNDTRIDLGIFKKSDSKKPVVFFETKRPDASDMFRTDRPNCKALQECVYYFMQESMLKHNDRILHIIITNYTGLYIFKAKDFHDFFINGTSEAVKTCKNFIEHPENFTSSNTGDFYEKYAAPAIDEWIQTKQFAVTHVDFTEYQSGKNRQSRKKLETLYKILSPEYLLNKPIANDNNSLNENFYNELLHIIGLEEVKDGQKKRIQRKKHGRNSASLLESAMSELSNNIFDEERCFEAALRLSITWVNRLLFLKLVEGQLVSYHQGNSQYKFLSSERIPNFHELNDLFFKILGRRPSQREDKGKFQFVPYLNSSLFEESKDEDNFHLQIRGIKNAPLEVFPKTVLKDGRGKRLTGTKDNLEYIFEFLDAYNFSSAASKDETEKQGKEIINAAVLGLIFEKINGYKDGSYFTPSFITEYMAKETIERAVVQKFNEKKGWKCSSIEELKNTITDDCLQKGKESANKYKAELNAVINSIHICDPAVGSGHFLVSVLNRLLYIKSYLCILQDADGKTIERGDFRLILENDEIFCQYGDGSPFGYTAKNASMEGNDSPQRIQKAIFHEKRTLIENCLFGEDINPASVYICRLRLWIELLKNAYYTKESDFEELETLPNIDINIKCGNSLVSKFKVEVGKSILQKDNPAIKELIKQYKENVKKYKNEHDKQTKQTVDKIIKDIKEKLRSEAQLNLPLNKDFQEANAKILSEDVYNNSMEWMIEFPELLDAEGIFQGFDVVIGNPPYGVSIKGSYRDVLTESLGKVPDFEIYYYFIECAQKLLSDDSVLSYIIPNTWLFNTYADSYRLSVLEKWNVIELLDCSHFKIFKSATVFNSIILFQKIRYSNGGVVYRPTLNANSFSDLISEQRLIIEKDELKKMNQNWGLAFKLDSRIIKIIDKISYQHDCINSSYDVIQGYIPYRLSDLEEKYGKSEGKRIKETRAWHSPKKSEKFWVQEIHGEDINKYGYNLSGDYVYYGKHVATYVDMRYFTGKRIIVREITNPKVIACIVSEQFIHDPQILPIITRKDSLYDLNIIWAILNSTLATFYHFNHSPKATKGGFPKIIVGDLKNFPLPKISVPQQKTIIALVDQILAAKKANPDADTSELEKEIDRLVYQLYELTDDEIAIIEGKSK